MKVKKNGRVYPSLPSPTLFRDPNSVFKLFPVAILALASALPTQDQEVLAYMITRSLLSTTSHHQSKSKCKKGKSPFFQCGCFDCYTRFWHRWDSSPNRDLIHQAIEAFEEHLLQNDDVLKKQGKTSRKKDKVILSACESDCESVDALNREHSQDCEMLVAENEGSADAEVEVMAGNLEVEVVSRRGGGGGVSHKGLARKVLPDVVGLFNSRLWSLWGPSI